MDNYNLIDLSSKDIITWKATNNHNLSQHPSEETVYNKNWLYQCEKCDTIMYWENDILINSIGIYQDDSFNCSFFCGGCDEPIFPEQEDDFSNENIELDLKMLLSDDNTKISVGGHIKFSNLPNSADNCKEIFKGRWVVTKSHVESELGRYFNNIELRKVNYRLL